MALIPCRECGREVSTEAPTCPHCGCPIPGRDFVSAPPTLETSADSAPAEAATAEPASPASDVRHGSTALVPPAGAAVSAPAGTPARKPMENRLGESILPGARGGAVAIAAFLAAMLLILWAVGQMVFGDPTWASTIQLFGAAAVLIWVCVGMASYSPMAHLATAAAFVFIGGWSAAAWLREPGDWPWLVAALASAAMVHYVWKVRRLLRTPGRIRFELGVQPFQPCEPLPGRAPQNALIELNNRVAETGRIRDLIPEDVLALETRHRVRVAAHLPAESQILYARYLRHFLDDDFLNDEEKAEIDHLERLLSLPAAARDAARRDIARWLYTTRVEEALHDGFVDADEQAVLDHIVSDLGLPREDAEKLFRERATGRVAQSARAAAADKRLTDDEAAELHQLARRLGVSLDEGVGGLTRPQLDRYRLMWQAESGPLPSAETKLKLRSGEICHFQTRAELREPPGGTGDDGSDPGTVAVTSHRLLFLGARDRVDLPLAKVSGIRPRPDGVEVLQAGERTRLYTFHKDPSEADLFVQILSRAMRAAGAGKGA
jgi:hypothetical protein